MSIDPKDAIADIDRVLNHDPKAQGGQSAVSEVMTLMSMCIDRWAPENSAYQERKKEALSRGGTWTNDAFLRGVLQALRADYAAGRTPQDFEQLVHAAVFADLIGQAEHLVDEGDYLLAAAVLGGAVLEEHLRQLAVLNEINPSKSTGGYLRASQLNDTIRKAGAYSEMQRTQVEAWLKLRNDAAHNTPAFKSVSKQQVQSMLSAIRDFIVRFPA